MFTLKQLITLALAGTTVAVPFARRGDDGYQGPFGRWRGNQGWKSDSTDVEIVPDTTASANNAVVTVYTVPQSGNHGGQQSSGSDTQAAAPAAASSGSDAGSSTDTGYMAIVNEWRAKGGLKALKQSSKLEANAMKTVVASHGSMVHQLNPGSNAQVLAPGNAGNFESVYVGGWLCEMPSLPGLSGVCGSMTKGWDHSDGELDHAKILTSGNYAAIGCALSSGIWACDLGSS